MPEGGEARNHEATEYVPCPHCSGQGVEMTVEDGGAFRNCAPCKGSGRILAHVQGGEARKPCLCIEGDWCSRLCGEARNHEAEVEAVARAMGEYVVSSWDHLTRSELEVARLDEIERARIPAGIAIAALDVVRRSPDSRERDVLVDFAAYLKVPTPWAATVDAFLVEYDGVSPPPKGEDHETVTIWRCPDHPNVAWLDTPEEGYTYCPQCDRDRTDDAVSTVYSRCPSPERDQLTRLVAGIQWVRGMCSDEEPYEVIDAKLAELLDEDHKTSDAVRGDPCGTPVEWPGRQPTDPDRGQLRDAAIPASGRGRQSAQGEDHEAGMVGRPDCEDCGIAQALRADLVALRSRASASERDTEKLQRAIDVAFRAMNSSAYVGGPTEREAWQTALAALGEVVTQHTGQGERSS